MTIATLTVGIVAVGAGLALGNFVYQAAGGQNYAVAFDRSFFQVIALLTAWVVLAVRKAGG